MASGRIDLQPSVTIAVGASQETRFAGRIPGGAKSGLLVVVVTSTSTSAGSIGIMTAADPSADASSWAQVSSTVAGLNTTGVKIATLGSMADYIRWYSTGLTASITATIVVYTFDA